MTTRRAFVSWLGGAATSSILWPLGVRAQQPRPVVGFLHPQSLQAVADRVAAFREGLKDGGYVEGRDLDIEFRWGEGRYDRLPDLARELVGRRVTAIVTGATPAALAAKAATSTIPIVFTGVGADPVKVGLVPSLSRPGSNVTGVSILTIDLVPKRLELLRELAPAATTIAALVNPTNPNAEVTTRDMTSAAGSLGRKLVVAKAATEADIQTAFSKFAQERADALLVDADSFFLAQRYRLVALTARHALPAIYEFREFASTGGLMSYGPNANASYRQAAAYVTRILKGEKPADLPVTQPTKFELVINLQTANALGFDVPATLLARADEVIE
jgi:putative ABC transport system substrate-binding protein